MTILAFDPGITTGIAVLDQDGGVIETYAAPAENFRAFPSSLKGRYPDAQVVAEQGPLMQRNNGPVIQTIEEEIRNVFPNAVWVNPGQWKGHPAARPDSSLRGKTQHEKDAVGLGRWLKATKGTSAKDSTG